jgi:hypothetical protein
VFPVNPKLEELEGLKCFKSLSDIPVKPDVVNIVVPPAITEKTAAEALKLGIKRIWMQPGAESEKAVKFCEDNGMQVIYGVCVMVY